MQRLLVLDNALSLWRREMLKFSTENILYESNYSDDTFEFRQG